MHQYSDSYSQLNTPKNVSCGSTHTAVLYQYGNVVFFGYNNYGQCDLLINHPEYELKIKSVVCGTQHSAVLLQDNTVRLFGNNNHDQCNLPM